jgi:hypothetical protein
MQDMNMNKRAVIGKAVTELALSAKPELKKSYSKLSSWRKGTNLPTLEAFIDYCLVTNTKDISFILNSLQNNT